MSCGVGALRLSAGSVGFEDARVVEGYWLADAQANDTLLAGQQVDVDQVSAAH